MEATFSTLAALILAGGLPQGAADSSYQRFPGVKSVTARFDPPEARPGQTVTLRLTVKLDQSWMVYAAVQPDRDCQLHRTRITYPKGGPVVFVGDLHEPADFRVFSEPDLGIKELRYYDRSPIVWERRAVVAPNAKPGKVVVLSRLVMRAHPKTACCAPWAGRLPAELTVLDAPARVVEPAYRSEVEKALRK